jgi:hypothetical protein
MMRAERAFPPMLSRWSSIEVSAFGSSGSVGLWALALAVALSGCGGADAPGRLVASGSDSEGAPGAQEGALPGGPTVPGVAGGSLVDEVAVGGACASQVAAETFTSAVCSCEDTTVAGYLRTRSFRSDPASPAAVTGAATVAGGSVGVNRDYVTAGYADVSGSFTVAGDRDIGFGGYLKTGADVRANPALDVAGVVDVGRDAFLKSDARVFGRVDIGRDLTMEAGAGIRGIAFVDVGGQRRTEAVRVDAPCACAPEQIIDVAALVEAARTDNDNARVGLEPDDLNGVVGIGAEVTLPRGRFFVHQLGGVGSLTLLVTGKAALFVEDDVVTTGLFRVELEPDAELDVFVQGNLIVTGAASFGDEARPSGTRIYVGGTGDVAIAGASAFVGNLYAPQANILVGGVGQVEGSLFGKNILAAGFLDLGYDESIREPGNDCPPPAAGDIPRLR